MLINKLKYDREGNVALKLKYRGFDIYIKTVKIFDITYELAQWGDLHHDGYLSPQTLVAYKAITIDFPLVDETGVPMAWLVPNEITNISKIKGILRKAKNGLLYYYGINISFIKYGIEILNINYTDPYEYDLVCSEAKKKILKDYINKLIDTGIKEAFYKDKNLFKLKEYDFDNAFN